MHECVHVGVSAMHNAHARAPCVIHDYMTTSGTDGGPDHVKVTEVSPKYPPNIPQISPKFPRLHYTGLLAHHVTKILAHRSILTGVVILLPEIYIKKKEERNKKRLRF